MTSSSKQIKTSYAVIQKLEPFYTGGTVQASKDGQYLLCQFGDKIQVVDTNTGQISASLAQEDDEVVTFCLSPDNTMVVSSHKSTLLRHWKFPSGQVERTWKSMHTAPASIVVFDPTSTLVASGGSDGALKIWDTLKQYCTHNLKGGSGVHTMVRFHPDMSKPRIYAASMDSQIRCWDLTNSSLVSTLKGHLSSVTGFSILPGNTQAISCGRDKVLIHWDLVQSVALKTVPTYESLEGLCVLPSSLKMSFLPEALSHPLVLTAGEQGVLKVWSIASSRSVWKEDRPSELATPITQLLALGDRQSVLSVTFDHNLNVYNLSSLQITKQYCGNNEDILDVALLGGKEHLAVASNSPQLRLYNLANFQCELVPAHSDIVLAIAVHPHYPELLATASKDNTVKVWVARDGKLQCIGIGAGHTGSVGTVSFSHAHSPPYVITGSQDTCLKLWPLPESWKNLSTPAHLSAAATSLAHEKDVNAVTVSPNDRLVASASQDKTAKLWQVPGLAAVATLRGHRRGLWCLQFSPVDQVLATGSADGNIKLWSLTDYSCISTLEGHGSSVLKVFFVSRGSQLVSSASDGLIKLWTLKTSECVATLDEHEGKIWALTLSQKEDLMVSGGSDSKIILWRDVSEEEAAKLAEVKAETVLQEQELSNLLHTGKLGRALKMAIRLDRPFTALKVLKELTATDPTLKEMEQGIEKLSKEGHQRLLGYAVTWNTNSKHCYEAQAVLSFMLKNYAPQELLSWPNLQTVLQAFLPYTDRHMQRVSRLQQQAHLLDYTAYRIQATSWKADGPERGNAPSPKPARMLQSVETLDDDFVAGSDSDEEMEQDEDESKVTQVKAARSRKLKGQE